jgi:lipid II:glycine glycyltransferase (peptidoglycan interpeptide bridge formation enzyme)
MLDKSATVIVDLNPSEEEILQNLQKDARWGIGRAKRDNLIIEKSDEWNKIYPMYEDTIALGGSNPESIEDLKEKAVVMFVCKKDEKIIAAAGIEIKGEIPTLYFNCSNPEFRQSQPNNLLYWECIMWCKKRDYKFFDLGGWQINARGHLHGVNKFKEKWGEIKYIEKDYGFREAIGRKLIRNSGFFWWLNKKLKGRR